MRWTLGLACLVTACFGEPAASSSTSAEDTTNGSTTAPTTGDTTTSTSDSTMGTTSDDTAPSSGPDMTESTGADTTAGDVCGMGSVPNPPAPPDPWSIVFVSPPAAQPVPCPSGMDPLAVGHFGIPADVDTCACSCDEPFHELCNLTYRHAAMCPVNNGAEPLDAECQALPADQQGFLGDATGTTCMPDAAMPSSELVNICAVPATEGPCIDRPADLIGPCLFQDGNDDCPEGTGLVAIDVGVRAACAECPPCPIEEHCSSAEFHLWGDADCTDQLLTFSDEACHETKTPVGSISALPAMPLTCMGEANLNLEVLTVCCPM